MWWVTINLEEMFFIKEKKNYLGRKKKKNPTNLPRPTISLRILIVNEPSGFEIFLSSVYPTEKMKKIKIKMIRWRYWKLNHSPHCRGFQISDKMSCLLLWEKYFFVILSSLKNTKYDIYLHLYSTIKHKDCCTLRYIFSFIR